MANQKLIGKVVSRYNQTVKVEITRRMRHPKYLKFQSLKRGILAHDETEKTSPGDLVEISETKPISRNKTWKINRVI